jgi:hypothetical protein
VTGLLDYSYSCECKHTWCDNLIPRIVARVLSQANSYSSTFGHVPTCIYMSHRPSESFVPEQQRKQYVRGIGLTEI